MASITKNEQDLYVKQSSKSKFENANFHNPMCVAMFQTSLNVQSKKE